MTQSKTLMKMKDDAIINNDLVFLKKMYAKGITFDNIDANMAIRQANLDITKWLYSIGVECDLEYIRYKSLIQDTEFIKWFCNK